MKKFGLIEADRNELEQIITIEYLPDGGYRKTIKYKVAVLIELDGHKYKIMHDGSVKKDGELILGSEADEILEIVNDLMR